eukprot:CAMPEP_0198152218 /NCGR_PEP_ID=MMETSP1443-20131203/58907_1 /TAXON_ID=186043 /ORGANISM="Entomoneis sp., Strain CCMP2396" /LENGTH=369 /DNA_ID=CAMNT_0043818169 /DNA_START=27 /DNA_END=1136 /DNA_ORIENTATION=-
MKKATRKCTGEVNTFDFDQFEIGNLLGQGGFSSVYSLSEKGKFGTHSSGTTTKSTKEDLTQHLDATNDSWGSSSATDSLENLESSPSSIVSMDGKLAMKRLRAKTLLQPALAKKAAKDLKTEVSILSSLPRQHQHIIHMFGVSTEFWTSTMESFIVLEQLEETLDCTIIRWKELSSQCGSSRCCFSKKQHLTRGSQLQRIQKVAIGIASAMKFLHKNRIVYRDLKPSNIGFAEDGKVRLFDFACARVLEHPGAKLLHRCGTLRYMAPEVAAKKEYDCSADVYSFGMLLWELCTLNKPFLKTESKAELNVWVQQAKSHLSVRKIASPRIKAILNQCWRTTPAQRPKFSMILTSLRKEVRRYNYHQSPMKI